MSETPITAAVGEIRIGNSPGVLRALGIGSCVTIAIYDPHLKLGGMGHALLPYAADARNSNPLPGKYADSATIQLIQMLVKKGANRTRLISKLAGGAKMFELLKTQKKVILDIGSRNVQSARDSLKKANIPIVAEDVGKNYGRTVIFELDSGKLITLRAGKKHRREL